jgi:putative membrane protein
MGWHSMDGWGWVWMTLVMAAFWGAVAVAAIALVRHGQSAPPSPTPEETLRQRLARGDIDTEEYRRRMQALHHAERG